jgi:hypothetical protein
MVFGEGTTPPCGHPSKGGELTLAGLGGSFPWMLFCDLTLWLIVAGTDYNPRYRTRRYICVIWVLCSKVTENRRKPS